MAFAGQLSQISQKLHLTYYPVFCWFLASLKLVFCHMGRLAVFSNPLVRSFFKHALILTRDVSKLKKISTKLISYSKKKCKKILIEKIKTLIMFIAQTSGWCHVKEKSKANTLQSRTVVKTIRLKD